MGSTRTKRRRKQRRVQHGAGKYFARYIAGRVRSFKKRKPSKRGDARRKVLNPPSIGWTARVGGRRAHRKSPPLPFAVMASKQQIQKNKLDKKPPLLVPENAFAITRVYPRLCVRRAHECLGAPCSFDFAVAPARVTAKPQTAYELTIDNKPVASFTDSAEAFLTCNSLKGFGIAAELLTVNIEPKTTGRVYNEPKAMASGGYIGSGSVLGPRDLAQRDNSSQRTSTTTSVRRKPAKADKGNLRKPSRGKRAA